MLPADRPAPRTVAVAASGARREQAVSQIGGRYHPWVHLLGPSACGLVLATLALASLRHVAGWELLTVPATLVLANALEWWSHKSLLHQKRRGATTLYEQHLHHHALFAEGDMAIRRLREVRLVLLPAYGIALILLTTLPVAALAWLLGERNVGALYIATSAAFVLSYEWLHLAYHLPPAIWPASSRLIVALRRHHARHHDPALMRRWNFNVTVPLWDLVRATRHRPRAT
jgi:hypothetical protein